MPEKYCSYPEYEATRTDWLGEAPKHWKTIPIGRLFSRIKRTGHTDKELLSVYRDFGVIPKSSRDDNNNKPSDDLAPYQLVEPNDLVMNKMKAWQGSIAISEFEGIVSPAYFVYQPLPRLFDLAYPKYIHYLLRHPIYVAQYLRQSKGIRVSQWDLDPEEFQRVELLLPEKDEQIRIFQFLDHETAKIDTLIEKQQQLIKLLKEKRQAVISHAVTKGLHPNAPMRDSGVECLGEVPTHWEVKKIRYLLNRNGLVRGPFGGDLKKEIFTPTGIKVLEQKNAIYQNIEIGDSFISEQKFEQMKRFEVFAGDYIMSCSGTIGKTFRIPSDGPKSIINQALMIMRFTPKISSDFLYWIFIADFFCNQILDNSQGGAMKNLVSMDIFKSVSLPVPPLEEQKNISDRIQAEVEKFDSLLFECQTVVTLLQERRTALISAAVTGKIDVRNWQAPSQSTHQQIAA